MQSAIAASPEALDAFMPFYGKVGLRVVSGINLRRLSGLDQPKSPCISASSPSVASMGSALRVALPAAWLA